MSLRRSTGALCALSLALSLALLLAVPAERAAAQDVSADSVHHHAPADRPLLLLDDLLAEVRAGNPALRAAHLEAEALAKRRAQVTTWPDPMVMATYQPLPLFTARGTQRSQWRVEQQVPYPGKLGLQGEIADLGAAVAGHEAEVLAEDLAFEVKEAYYHLHHMQQQQALVRGFQERLASFEDVAATQYAVGTGMQQAILKAQLEKNTLAQQLLDLEARRRTAVETLARLVNRPLEGDFETHVVLPPVPAAAVEDLVAVALSRRPEVEALEAAEARAARQVALAEKQFLPDLGVNATYFDLAATDVMPTATGRDALALGVSVKVPLQRGRLRAQVEEARVRAAQVAARQDDLTVRIRTHVADLVSRLRQEAGQMALYQDLLLPQAETTLEATLSAYTTGRTDFLDLLDAERTRFRLHLGYRDARMRYLYAAAALERALGVAALADLP